MRTKAIQLFLAQNTFFKYPSPFLLTHNSIITLPLKALFSPHHPHHISIFSFLLLLRFARQIRTCYIIAQVNLSNWISHQNIAHDLISQRFYRILFIILKLKAMTSEILPPKKRVNIHTLILTFEMSIMLIAIVTVFK